MPDLDSKATVNCVEELLKRATDQVQMMHHSNGHPVLYVDEANNLYKIAAQPFERSPPLFNTFVEFMILNTKEERNFHVLSFILQKRP